MSPEDERPLLVCRVECPRENLPGLDEWMPKHFDDSLDHAAVTSAANYAVMRDWEGLPALFNQHGNRFIVYVADGFEGLKLWLDSPQIREAIEDGVDRESQYPHLDDEPFNGVIYEVAEIRRPVGADFAGRGPIVVERFEVSPETSGEFDAWLNGAHLDAVERWPGVVRVRTWRQNRDGVPRRFPYDRYVGKGNRMIWAEFEEGTQLRRLFEDEGVRSTLVDSQRWDMRLGYVRREACEHLLTRYAGDAEREAAVSAMPA